MMFYNRFLQKYVVKRSGGLCMLLLLAAAILTQPVFAQSSDTVIRTAVRQKNVYVYNTLKIPLAQGYNIYRSGRGGKFEKLNEKPVKGAQNVAEFMGEAGDYVPRIRKALELDNPQAVYLRLRSSRLAANLVSFYYPDVARALGHLFVDSTAVIGQTVTYRIELVDDQGDPTGKNVETKVTLKKTDAPQPTGLKAEHSRRQVTLTWNYPTSSMENDDKIMRFNLYDKQNGEMRKINENPIVRINNFKDFTQTFTVPRVGETLNLVVMPVDLTMHEGPASKVLTYTVADKTPPAIISGLQTVAKDNGKVEITWPVSTEADAAGYNLFRANRIKGNYKKLNDKPITLLETYYVDAPPELKTSYFYRVSAIDSAGNESKRSNAAKADVEDHVPPVPPAAFKAIAQENGTVKLTWEAAKENSGLKSYILLRRLQTRFAGKANAQLNDDDLVATSYIDKGEADINFAEGARYRYQIFAVDSARNFSDTLTTFVKIPDLTPPQPPTNLVVENHDGVWAVLRWNASVSTDVTKYVLFRGVDPNNLDVYRDLSVKTRMVRDDSVKVGQTYFYAVAAVDSLGNRGDHTKASQFLMKDFTAPRAVRNVRAIQKGGSTKITWEPVPTSDLKGYRIYTSSIPTGVYKSFNKKLVEGTEFNTTDLDTGAWIQVRAVDTSGNESRDSKPAKIYKP